MMSLRDQRRRERREALIGSDVHARLHGRSAPRRARPQPRRRVPGTPRQRKMLAYGVIALVAIGLMVYAFARENPRGAMLCAFAASFALAAGARQLDGPGTRERWKARGYLLIATVGGCFFVYGLYRLVAFDEQFPARSIGGLSGFGAGLALAAWAELRDERKGNAEPRENAGTGAARDVAGFLVMEMPPDSRWGRRVAYAGAVAGLAVLSVLIAEVLS